MIYSSGGKVFRGKDNTGTHAAATYRGRIHIDPEYLDKAAENFDHAGGGYYSLVADIMLHETAHEMGKYGHHEGETQTPYQSFPYNHINGGPAEQ